MLIVTMMLQDSDATRLCLSLLFVCMLQRVLVFPNMDDLYIPIMCDEKTNPGMPPPQAADAQEHKATLNFAAAPEPSKPSTSHHHLKAGLSKLIHRSSTSAAVAKEKQKTAETTKQQKTAESAKQQKTAETTKQAAATAGASGACAGAFKGSCVSACKGSSSGLQFKTLYYS